MTSARAIAGDFADLRTVKTRSVIQIVIEVPIEDGEAIVKMFGFPQPGKPVKLAVARLNSGKEVMPNIPARTDDDSRSGLHKNWAGDGHRNWSDLSPAQQAGIRCSEQSFQKFLRERGGSNVNSESEAATYVRLACLVNTRSDIKPGTPSYARWQELDHEFQVWLHEPDLTHESREVA